MGKRGLWKTDMPLHMKFLKCAKLRNIMTSENGNFFGLNYSMLLIFLFIQVNQLELLVHVASHYLHSRCRHLAGLPTFAKKIKKTKLFAIAPWAKLFLHSHPNRKSRRFCCLWQWQFSCSTSRHEFVEYSHGGDGGSAPRKQNILFCFLNFANPLARLCVRVCLWEFNSSTKDLFTASRTHQIPINLRSCV